MVSGLILLVIAPINAFYGLSSATPRSKFYLNPWIQTRLGSPVGQPVWGPTGAWTAQDTAFVLLALLWLAGGVLATRRPARIKLERLLKIVSRSESVQVRERGTIIRRGLKVTLPDGITGTIEHITPDSVSVRTGDSRISVDTAELEGHLADQKDE
jgi:hypothetical protein